MQPQVIPQHVDSAREMIRQMVDAARLDAGENDAALGEIARAEVELETGFDRLREAVTHES